MLRANIRVWGIPIKYIRDGAEHDLKGIFDANAEAVVLSQDGPEIDSTGPQLGINRNDLPFEPKRGDRVLLVDSGKRFVVFRQKPDSEHGIKLILHEENGDEP